MPPVAIALVLVVLTQQWSGLDTPDSEFYASLAIFTDQVTDRAPIDSYYWTRLGLIAPIHGLISLFGIWEGFALYKAFLVLVITSSIYASVRLFTGLWRATWITAAGASSSVLLAYLGNPYITGSIMAGTSALIALGLRQHLITGAVAGVVLGWMAMTYPGGALLGGTIWLGLLTYSHFALHEAWKALLPRLTAAAVATLITLIMFLLVGRILFPGLDWLGTYLDASSFDYSVYSSGEWVWLRDISLLVPTSVLVLAAFNVRRALHRTPADLALVISATSIGFILGYAPFFGAHFLEAPPSQAMLWPPAMIAFGLVVASRLPTSVKRSWQVIAASVVALIAIVAFGYSTLSMPFLVGSFVAVLLVTVVLLAPQRTLLTLLAAAVFLSGAQVLQNARPPLGQFMLDPYYWAFRDNPNEEKIRTAVNAQQWLLDNTTSDDRVLLWVDGPWVQGDRELYTVASMQLWGENRITLEPEFGDQFSIQQMSDWQPTVIAMYAKTMDAVDRFYASLPAELGPTPPQCYDFTWPTDPTSAFPTNTGHLCLTRLDQSR